MKGQATTAAEYRGKKAEWFAFALLVISYIVIGSFHEPWFGEAEAWQIARCASLKEILFHIPHYEGHPPLWYLMLAIPAKLGFPYELSLKTIAGIATMCSGWLILFRSPFPRPVRLLLPFHYFFFYQYGIVARPYGYMVLCLLLMALTYKEKEQKPWRFILAMLFLCLFSAYGIVLAGGVSAVWVWEICREKRWKLFSGDFWRDKRVILLSALLVAAVLLILEIFPRSDAYANSGGESNSILLRLLYTCFVMLPESMVTTILQGEHFLKYSNLMTLNFMIGLAMGAVLLLAITAISSGKNLRYFLFPYFLFAVFSAVVYFNAHHVGIALAFTVFWLWTALEDPGRGSVWGKMKSKWKLSEKDQKTLQKAVLALAVMFAAVPLYWTVMASYLDIREPYFFGRDTARFIKENGLEELSIMSEWDISAPKEGAEYDVYENIDTNLVHLPVTILPYMQNMTVWNMGMGDPSKAYVEHRVAGAQENAATIEKWREHEIPEMLIGEVDLVTVYGEEIAGQYVAVYCIRPVYANIWKSYLQSLNLVSKSFIFLRKDLLDKYGLEAIDVTQF